MNTDIKPSWLRMSMNKLHALLRKREYPEPLIRDIIKTVVAERNTVRAKRIKNAVAYKLWDELLTPARTELGILRVMKYTLSKPVMDNPDIALSEQDERKLSALQSYSDVVSETVNKLRKVQNAGEHTPHQFINFIRKEKGRVIPNRGEHWSDFVSASDKERIRGLFANMPDPVRGRRKVPFERKIAPVAYERAYSALVARINDETLRTEQELGMVEKVALEQRRNPFELEELEAHLRKLQEAQVLLDLHKKNTPLPATWHGLLGEEPDKDE